MNRRQALPLLGLPLLLAGCGPSDVTIHYRTTVYVETPEGMRTGASVVQHVYRAGYIAGGMVGRYWEVHKRGEAVAVDLGTRGVLFSLLREDPDRLGSRDGPYPGLFPAYVPEGLKKGSEGAAQLERLKRSNAQFELAAARAPMLVRFRDIRDPKTVEMVNPTDLSLSFGPGVRLLRLVFEVTSDPMTDEIKQRLTWLAEPENRNHLQNKALGVVPTLANKLDSTAFRYFPGAR